MPSKATLAIQWPVFKPRGWGSPANGRELPKPWYGLDTERDSKNGEFVTGWCVGESTFKFEKITHLPSATYWIWNLNYDIEGLIRDLRLPEGWALRADGAQFELLEGSAVYYHGKRFTWRFPDGRKLSFIEASSFYGRQRLSDVGAKLSTVKASEMSLERYRTDIEYRRLVDEYCQQDARVVYDRITSLAMDCNRLGVHLGSTPGGTARRFMSRLGEFSPVLWQSHKEFLRSYCGGRFEVTKRGVIHNVKQYDLVSAYPWALSQCPWLTKSAYHRSTRRFSDNALYGSYLVGFQQDSYLGIAPRWKKGIRVYSKAEKQTWLTRPEVDWLLRRNVKLTLIRGVEIFDEGATDTWRDVIEELFLLKKRGKNEPGGGWGAKIILNSQYGVLIQLIRRSGRWVKALQAVNPIDFAGTLALEEPPKEFEGGKYFAPAYAGHLTALTRCRLLDAADLVGEDAYCGGHTDSVLTTRELRLGIGNELGDWELKDEAVRADICKTGQYALDDKIKIRGITRDGKATMLWEPEHQRKTRIGIKSAARWEDVSVIVPKQVANNFAAEQKRLWDGDVTRGLIAMEKFVDSEALAYVAA